MLHLCYRYNTNTDPGTDDGAGGLTTPSAACRSRPLRLHDAYQTTGPDHAALSLPSLLSRPRDHDPTFRQTFDFRLLSLTAVDGGSFRKRGQSVLVLSAGPVHHGRVLVNMTDSSVTAQSGRQQLCFPHLICGVAAAAEPLREDLSTNQCRKTRFRRG